MNVNPLDLTPGDKVFHSPALEIPMRKLSFFCRVTDGCYRFFTIGSSCACVQLIPDQISTECYPCN